MTHPGEVFHFADYRLDPHGGGLFRRDAEGALVPVAIGPRALGVLSLLVDRAGELVTRDEIIAAVWPDVIVDDNNLNMQIAALRRALDGERTTYSCIQTITRRGYRFVAPVARAEKPALLAPVQPLGPSKPDLADHPPGANPPPSGLRHRFVLAVVGVLVLIAAATAAWQVPFGWLRGASPMPRMSIVVLPFANLGDPAQQYFADAITEDLTTDLSRLTDMLVISYDTAFTYKGRPVDARRIGRELSVRYLLEGSVERSGNQLRVNAQLVSTETDAHLWAERFDRSIGDLLAMQNEITGRIAVALNLRLIASEAARPTGHADALDHIFRGRADIYKPASRQNFAAAIAEFQQALGLDPGSVEGQSRLATALITRVLDEMSDTAEADLEQANRLIEHVLATTPHNPLAHFAKGQLLRAEHHCNAAIPEYEAVLAANRNALSSIGNIGRCEIYLGRFDDGVTLEERAIRLSPRDPFLVVWYLRIGQARLLQAHVDEAIGWLEKAHDENPAFPFVPVWLAAAYGLKGDVPRATAELAEARKLDGNRGPTSIAAARIKSFNDFASPATKELLENTLLAGLHQAGLPDE